MKKNVGALMLAAFVMAGHNAQYGQTHYVKPPETEEEKQKRQNRLKKAQGLQEFSYQGGTVWALNQKTADKKAIKLGLK